MNGIQCILDAPNDIIKHNIADNNNTQILLTCIRFCFVSLSILSFSHCILSSVCLSSKFHRSKNIVITWIFQIRTAYFLHTIHWIKLAIHKFFESVFITVRTRVFYLYFPFFYDVSRGVFAWICCYFQVNETIRFSEWLYFEMDGRPWH